MTSLRRGARGGPWSAALVASLAASCGCEGRAFEVWRGETTVAQGCAEVSDTAEGRARGLRGRSPLPEGDALWLEFPLETEACIVNEGVSFPIDVAWVASDGEVRALAHGLPAGETGARCHPGTRRVLEWTAGGASSVAVGDRVRW